jgi:hypothetical protein
MFEVKKYFSWINQIHSKALKLVIIHIEEGDDFMVKHHP